MIRPQRRSFICGTSARVNAMHEVRFTSMTRSQSSSRILSIGSDLLPPALLIRMSTRPNSASDPLGQLSHFLAPGHVGLEPGHLDVGALGDFRGGLLQLVFVPAGDGDLCAGFGQSPRHRLSQPFAAAGDQRDATAEIE